MSEENKVKEVDTPAQQEQPTFTQEQQEKVNSLIRQERIRILTKLGVNSVEEGVQKIESSKEVESLREKANAYEKLVNEKKELEGENAMLEVGISNDYKGIVKNYFKGSNEDLTKDNLTKFLDENPKLKEQWIENKGQKIVVGNPQPNEKPDTNGYNEFRKYTRY